MRQNLIKSKCVLFLLMLLLVVGNNSCKKNQVAEATTSTVDQLSDNQKIHPAEITNWMDGLSFKFPFPLEYNRAQQAVINGRHVVKIPITSRGNDAALFITKVNDSLKVYSYKWHDETTSGKKFTGKITSFSFQDYKDRMLFYNAGTITKIIYSRSNAATTNKASLLSAHAKTTNIFADLWSDIQDAWCWATGGSWGLNDEGTSVDCNDQWSYGGGGGDSGGDISGGYGGTSDNGTGGNYGGGGSTGGDPGYSGGSTGDPGYGGGNYVYGGGSSWTPTTGGPSPDQFSMYDFGPGMGGGIYEPTDNDLNITPDPDNNLQITQVDNADFQTEPLPPFDPTASYYTLDESDNIINNLQNGAVNEDPIELYMMLLYKGSKLLDLSMYSIAANEIKVGDYYLMPHYDRNNNLLFYSAWRNSNLGIEFIIRADALTSFKQNYKVWKTIANWFYINGKPTPGQIQYAAGDYFKGLKTMWTDAIHSPAWWAYAISTLLHISIDVATPSPKTTLLETSITSDMVSDLNIPSNYTMTVSNKGDGIKFVNPNNIHDYVRVMPGNSSSPWPSQQIPYVVRMLNGSTLDINGNMVLSNSEAAHIPVTQYKFNR